MAHRDKQVDAEVAKRVEDAHRIVEDTRKQVDAEAARQREAARKVMDDARKLMDDARKQIEAARKEIEAESRRIFAVGGEQLEAGRSQMQAAREEVAKRREAAQRRMQAAREQLEATRKQVAVERVRRTGGPANEEAAPRPQEPAGSEELRVGLPFERFGDSDSLMVVEVDQESRSTPNSARASAPDPAALEIPPDDPKPARPGTTLPMDTALDRGPASEPTPAGRFVSNVEFGEAPPVPPQVEVSGVEFDE